MESVEELSLHIGDAVTRRLPGLGSAGYEWHVTTNPNHVVAVSLSYVPDPVPANTTFSRDSSLTIEALACGRAEIILEQKRAFEREPRRRFAIRVNVE